MLSILAGMMISMGCIVYLICGGPIGATLFSVGLLTILVFKFELFTGKAGLLATNEITGRKLLDIWCGNFVGTLITAFVIYITPKGVELSALAAEIVQTKAANGELVNFIYGVFCGLLMYIAVTAWKYNPIYAIMPVVVFILCGFNHCVADMFYLNLGSLSFLDYGMLIPTTTGNIVGAMIIPGHLALLQEQHNS